MMQIHSPTRALAIIYGLSAILNSAVSAIGVIFTTANNMICHDAQEIALVSDSSQNMIWIGSSIILATLLVALKRLATGFRIGKCSPA